MLGVCTAASTGVGSGWKLPCRNQHMDMRIDPKDLPEHLQSLLIDTGVDHPICLPPRRLPITKQYVDQAEVQKMINHGRIELCQCSWVAQLY